jgi:hypothetical protein
LDFGVQIREKKTMRFKTESLLVPFFKKLSTAAVFLIVAASGFAQSPNSNVKYFGYAWSDTMQNSLPIQTAGTITENVEILNVGKSGTLDTNISNLQVGGPAGTNFNVVHTFDSLQNAANCTNNRCVISISAGAFPSSLAGSAGAMGAASSVELNQFDICPEAVNSDQCTSGNRVSPIASKPTSYQKIWSIAQSLQSLPIDRLPAAVYFLDEPSLNPALRNNNAYVAWQYANYVCTLKQALLSYNLRNGSGNLIPIFTIIAKSELYGVGNISLDLTTPIQHCVGINSRPDWVGIDHYDWNYTSQTVNDASAIYSLYTQIFPPNLSGMPKWMLVPLSNSQYKSLMFCQSSNCPNGQTKVLTDQELYTRIQTYWEFLVKYPSAPVVAVMPWQLSKRVMVSLPNEMQYTNSRALLKFMGNRLLYP